MSLLQATVTDTVLAELAGYDARHIRRLAADGVLPKTGRNAYPLGDCIKALLTHTSGQSDTTAMQAAKLRRLEAQATLTELELAKARGEVALIEDFQRVQEQTFTLIRTNMLNVPRRVFASIVGETSEERIKTVLTNEITQILNDAAEALQQTTPDDLL